MQSVGLQILVRNQLTYRDTHFVVPLRVSETLPGVANGQDIDRLQVGREVKFTAQNVRFEVAYPYAAQAQLRGLEHHMVGQDGGINVPGLFLVKGPHPCLVVIRTDDDGKGRTVDVGGFANFRQSVLTLNSDQVNRLKISGGGGAASKILASFSGSTFCSV